MSAICTTETELSLSSRSVQSTYIQALKRDDARLPCQSENGNFSRRAPEEYSVRTYGAKNRPIAVIDGLLVRLVHSDMSAA